jgi:rhodanese-related sulfurtransferase
MKLRIIQITLLVFLTSAIQLWCYNDVTPAEVYARLANGDTLILLDVREVIEYHNGHIAEPYGFLPLTPVNMPWNSNVLQSEFSRLPDDIDIIVYCHSGGRSAAASLFLETNGYTRIYNMLNGFGSWTYDTRTGGYGDHSGKWVHPNDPAPVEIFCIGSGDTSKIIFPPTALPTVDSIYLEMHFASNKPFTPPDVPLSDMEGLFRFTILDPFGLNLFDGDSLELNDTANIKLIPDFHGNIVFYPALKIFVPIEGWQIIESTFTIPAFYRDENILRRWYNCEGWKTTDVAYNSFPPEDFNVAAFPNPFNGILQIVAPDDAKIFIYDIKGGLIEELKSPVWSPDFMVGSGVYILSVHFKNQVLNKGIVYLK